MQPSIDEHTRSHTLELATIVLRPPSTLAASRVMLQHSVLTVPSPRAAVFTSASPSSRIAGHRSPLSSLLIIYNR
jgi:hypothetical protein